MANRYPFGRVIKKRLSDITNSQPRPKFPSQDEKARPRSVSSTNRDYISQLHEENMALTKLLADKNKIIEFSGLELQKLRINLQRVQKQNRHLAQANSQMLAALNLGRDRLKSLHHELGCKNALVKAKNLQVEEKVEVEFLQANGSNKTCNSNRRHQSRKQSISPYTVNQQVAVSVKNDNKRLCLRRKSARFKSEPPEPTEDLFEIEDAKFHVCSLPYDPMHEDGSISLDSSVRKEEISALNCATREVRRLSISGRPLQKAAEKVQCYKEVPVNIKMRRSK